MTRFRPVKHASLLLTVLILVGSFPIRCQTNGVQDQLNAAYKGKILVLRNFYTGNELVYDRNGILHGAATQGPWTLADVEIKAITFTAQGVEIVGDRLGVLYTAGKPGLIKIGRLKIHLAKPALDADTKAALDPILAKIFIDPTDDLGPLLPDSWRYYLAGTDPQSRFSAWKATLEKGPVAPLEPKDFPPGKINPPRVISSPDPKYTKEAASHHIEGLCRLGAVIDATGTPVNIAILQPLGMGLDEQAVLALGQWKFHPSTLYGEPVRVQINVEINFKCCP